MRHLHPSAAAAALVLVPAAAALALPAGAPGAPLATPAPSQELKDADHKKLGKLLEKYIEELDAPQEQAEVRADLRTELEKIGKKLAGKDGDAMQAALALTEDLERAVGLSFQYKNVRGGKVTGETLTAQGATIEYAVWLPSDYKVSQGPYPLVLVAPDVRDGRPVGGETLLQEFWTDADTREAFVLAAVTMPEDSATWSRLFVDDGSGQSSPGGLFYLMSVFGELRKQYSIDADRVFLAGRGAGVPPVMHLGGMFPHLFAGVIGQAGDAGEPIWQNFQNLPVFLQGGGAQATAFEEKAKEAGYTGVTLKADAAASEVLTWLVEHPRNANPSKVTLVPGSPIPNSAYWIEVPPMDVEEGTYVKGEIDRATNTVRIEGKGVRDVVLYFNDLLVDMGQPIKVVLNGEEQPLVAPRSLDDFLSLFERGTNDPGRVYVARRSFALPE